MIISFIMIKTISFRLIHINNGVFYLCFFSVKFITPLFPTGRHHLVISRLKGNFRGSRNSEGLNLDIHHAITFIRYFDIPPSDSTNILFYARQNTFYFLARYEARILSQKEIFNIKFLEISNKIENTMSEDTKISILLISIVFLLNKSALRSYSVYSISFYIIRYIR